MGILGKIIKRQSAEDSEDLDFDDEMVDSLDMPGEEGGSRVGILAKILKRRRKAEPEEDSPLQVVRLEGIPDVHPVGDSSSSIMPGQEQTGPTPESAGSAVPGSSRPDPSPGAQPAADSSQGEGNTPVDLPTDTEGNTTDVSSDPNGEDLHLALQDIFAGEEVVDESLRDLADFVEDTLAQELASELREFLEELEARQK